MRKISVLLLLVFVLFSAYLPVQAAGTPPPDATPFPATPLTSIAAGFPWGLVLVFIVAGFIITYFKKNSPNTITTTCCVPLIDEKKLEAEKKKIAEEEALLRKP